MVSPLLRITPEGVISVAGGVGEAPLVESPVDLVTSPWLLQTRSFTPPLFEIPGDPPGVSGPYPSPPPAGPSADAPAEEFWIVKVMPSACASESWKVKSVGKLVMFWGWG